MGLFDTRHVVYRPIHLSPDELEAGYWRAYREFYRWRSIWRGASAKTTVVDRMRHLAYAGGWKKFEALWNVAIRSGQVLHLLPLLELVLSRFGRHRTRSDLRRPMIATDEARVNSSSVA